MQATEKKREKREKKITLITEEEASTESGERERESG